MAQTIQELIKSTPDVIPAWRVVQFPCGRLQVYKDLPHATNGRIIARAWFNYEKQVGFTVGWAAFARYLGIDKKTKHNRAYRSINDAVSADLYGYVIRGTLPKAGVRGEALRKLIELSGYPWE